MERDLKVGHYRRILFCTDFSENAKMAFDYAIDAALRNVGCELTLLHVIPEPSAQFWKGYIYGIEDVDDKARADIDEAVARDYSGRVPESVVFKVEMRIGEASQVILDYASESQTDLLILGRQGRGALTQWLMGNVTVKVTRRARCPILVIPNNNLR